MDAVAVVMIGAGAWLLYSAWRNMAPLTTAKSILSPKGYRPGPKTEKVS
jgi:hypothetical protein